MYKNVIQMKKTFIFVKRTPHKFHQSHISVLLTNIRVKDRTVFDDIILGCFCLLSS